EQAAWLRVLAAARQARGDRADAVMLYTRLTEKRPDDLRAWRALFELAAREGDRARLEKVTLALEKIEGGRGATWRLGKALLLATSGRPEDRAAALRQLQEAKKHSPRWGKLYLLGGQLEESRGDIDKAVENYKAALKQGEATPQVVASLVG